MRILFDTVLCQRSAAKVRPALLQKEPKTDLFNTTIGGDGTRSLMLVSTPQAATDDQTTNSSVVSTAQSGERGAPEAEAAPPSSSADAAKSNANKDVWSAQSSLERHASLLLRRVHRLQAFQAHKHIARHVAAFVKYQQAASSIGCQARRAATGHQQPPHPQHQHQHTPPVAPPTPQPDLVPHLHHAHPHHPHAPLNHSAAPTAGPQPVSSAEEKIKLYPPEDVKHLSTSELVSLVKKLEHASSPVPAGGAPQPAALDGNDTAGHHPPPPPLQPAPTLSAAPTDDATFAVSVETSPLPTGKVPSTPSKLQVNKRTHATDQWTVRGSVLNDVECEQTVQTTLTLRGNLQHLEFAYDSDATESSSGGESSDEFLAEELCSSGPPTSSNQLHHSQSVFRKHGSCSSVAYL